MFGGLAQRISLSALILGTGLFTQAHAQSSLCGTEVVNRLELDATPILQKCILSAEHEVRLVPGRYYLRTTLDLGSKSEITIRTAGTEEHQACLSTPKTQCAILTASSENGSRDPLLLSKKAKGLVLDHIAIDGNIGVRRARWGNDVWDGGGYNAKIHDCESCRFIGFASVQAVQGTGLEFSGDNAVFDHVLFRDNGWDALSLPHPKAMHWADGLTIWSSVGIKITNSLFANNTDIDLILGNAPHAQIENNTFINNFSYAFAAVMLDNFNSTQDGDFTGAVVRKNKVRCGQGMCGIGINIGPHLWYKSSPVRSGRIFENQIEGARQGILVNGAIGTEIFANQILGPTPYRNDACVTQPLSFSHGDQVNIHDNSSEPKPSLLGKCWPQRLAETIYTPEGVAPEIAKIFRDTLARNPDSEGGLVYTKAWQQGESLKNIRRFMASSEENTRLLGILSDLILDADLTEANRNAWQAFLADGGSIARLRVLLQLSK